MNLRAPIATRCALALALPLALTVSACGASNAAKKTDKPGGKTGHWDDSAALFPSARHQGRRIKSLDLALVNAEAKPIAIVGATIMTAAGKTIEDGTVVLDGGKILAIGKDVTVPDHAEVIDGKGRFITPGIIDSHSHIGVYSAPATAATADGNEMVAPSTPHARARYGYWTQDPQITRARAGGVTTALILPGSANFIGGRGYTVVMKPGGLTSERVFPGAPATLKMACGENPKRVYGEKGGPQTRMGLYAMVRDAFQKAAEYNVAQAKYERDYKRWKRKRAAHKRLGKKGKGEASPDPPAHDLGKDTLAAVLRGEVLVQVHCYRASDMEQMVEISDEYDFSIRSFHHAIEAYKIRDLLITHNISISTWADWWGFKMEAMDGIPENAALLSVSGGRPIIHSDSALDIQHLNHEAAKAMYTGRAAGLEISEDEALRWITANPAWALGIESVAGTLEEGKRADAVLWSGHPFSVYSLADVVIQSGEVTYRRAKGRLPTDFELGNSEVDPLTLPSAAKTGSNQTETP